MKKILISAFALLAFAACKTNTSTANNAAENTAAKTYRGEQPNAVLQLIDTTQLTTIDSASINNAINKADVYNVVYWKNRAIIYGDANAIAQIENAFTNIANLKVEKQSDVLYNYNRTWCDSVETEGTWRNYILSANLVEDTAKQNAYVLAHNTQREKWPDVGNGFCNANFQQLQIFKMGRQLILIIRVPEGKTLEELDPKTLENNPKMVEWNHEMKDYQTGIEGTAKGETWVFFQ